MYKRIICFLLSICLAAGYFAAGAAPRGQAAEVFQLDAEELTLEHKGDRAALYSGELDPGLIDWYSEDISVAINYQGTVIAVGPGETTVYAEFEGQRRSCKVTCTADPEEPTAILEPAIRRAPQRKPPQIEEDVGAFFDDAVFMGDSTSYSLYKWEVLNDQLGGAEFLVRGSVSIHSLVSGARRYFHNGVEMRPEDALQDMGKKKLFVMLGINDVGRIGKDETLDLMDQLLANILEKSPHMEIYIQSLTPIRVREQGEPYFTNAEFDAFNELLKAYAQEHGHHYVNIAPYFKDNENALVESYSYDKVHCNEAGNAVWAQALREYAAQQLGVVPAEEPVAGELTLAHKGDRLPLEAWDVDPALVDWYSDDVSVALNYEGTAIAVGPGETTLHAEYDGQHMSWNLTCTADPEEAWPVLTPEIWQAPQRRAPLVREDVKDFFADAIFMGDSTSYSLYLWNAKHQELGKPLFLVRGGVSIFSLIDGMRKFFHNSVEKRVEDAVRDAVAEEGRKKLFILLGANDLPQFGVERTMELMDELLGLILEKSPNLEIYIQSLTPSRSPGASLPDLDNPMFDEYNEALEAYAREKGFHYVPIAPYFKDNRNSMVLAYSYDRLHANDDGCAVWAEALEKFALEELG